MSTRRATSYLLALMLVAFAAGYHYFQKSPHESSPATRTEQTPSPVAVPGSAAVEGPYFSDGGRVAERIVAAINRSQKLIHVAVYDLTHPEIAAALVAAHRRGVEVRIATDEGQSGGPHSEIAYLRSQGIAVRLSGGYRGNRSIMHNKFAVFDGKLAETGSYNWTISADRFNYENALFIADPAVVARYEKEFERIWSQAQ